MQRAARLTTAQRNRALGRLRTLTVGTALASTAATGVFGYLAVVTDPGTQVTGDPSTGTTSDNEAVVAASTTGTSTDSGTSSSSSTTNAGTSSAAIPTATAPLQAATTAPVTTTRRGHASSGGS